MDRRADRSLGADLERAVTEKDSPASEVRPLAPGRPRTLCVATRLRGTEAETSLLTVTDGVDQVYFEGPLTADGCVSILLPETLQATVVRVSLDTGRWHRQADVTLREGLTEHAFA